MDGTKLLEFLFPLPSLVGKNQFNFCFHGFLIGVAMVYRLGDII